MRIVSLSIALHFCLACAHAPAPVSTAPASESARVNLRAVAYRTSPDGQVTGTTFGVGLEVREQPGEPTRVAVFEEFSGGAGAQWRATAWVAAIHASQALGHPLDGHQISVSVGGFIDGPSAGALMTAGLMAAMAGVPVDDSVTFTGTVNPDGTIGPVSGIAHKMRAAAAAGCRTFGYPTGVRIEVEAPSGEQVDLASLGRSLGLRTVPLRSIDDAFALLTHRRIQQPRPLGVEQMDLHPDADVELRAQVASFEATVVSALSLYRAQPEALQGVMRPSAVELVQLWEDSQRLLAQGHTAVGHHRAQLATLSAVGLSVAGRTLDLAEHEDLQRLLAEAQRAAAADRQTTRYLEELAAIDVRTVGEFLTLRRAYEFGIHARGYADQGTASVERMVEILGRIEQGEPGARDEFARATIMACMMYRVASLLVDLGSRARERVADRALALELDEGRLMRAARDLSVAGKAVFDYYESVAVEPVAATHGISPRTLRGLMFENDAIYRRTRTAVTIALAHRQPETVNEAVLALAAGEIAYSSSSFLVMRDYSLRVESEGVRPVRVGDEYALQHALELAHSGALEAAAVANARLGTVPNDVRIRYQLARFERGGDLEERLGALQGLWRVATSSRTAVAVVVERKTLQ